MIADSQTNYINLYPQWYYLSDHELVMIKQYKIKKASKQKLASLGEMMGWMLNITPLPLHSRITKVRNLDDYEVYRFQEKTYCLKTTEALNHLR